MFIFDNLDSITRQHMLMEVDQAIKASQLNFSKRFNEAGCEKYPQLLREAVAQGNEQTLAEALQQNQCFNTHEQHGTKQRKVPANAHITFAEGEFNAYYMRAICLRAIQQGVKVEVYRAKESANPRSSSQLKEGQVLDPQQALNLLKHSADGTQRGPNMPAGSNSGLSLRLTTKTA